MTVHSHPAAAGPAESLAVSGEDLTMAVQKVLIAGAEPTARQGLAEALAGMEGVVVDSATELGERVEESPHVVVCASMPGEAIDQLVERLRRAYPRSRLVLWLMDASDRDALVAVRMRVEGIVDRQSSRAELIEAAERVSRGEFFIPARIALRLLGAGPEPERRAAPALKSRLSNREREVLRLIAEGDTNREIGNKLSISENTVRAHVRLIIQKLRVRNRAQAAAVAAAGQLQALAEEESL